MFAQPKNTLAMKFFISMTLIALSGGLSAQTNLFTNIEAVEYDPGSGRFFVSNGNSIVQKLPDGSYSLFGNAQASHGMEVLDGKLFVVKSGNIRAYDLATAEQLMNITVPGAQFMNGMATDGVDRLWVSDFSAKKIYEINVADVGNPVVSTVVANTVSTPNGLVYDGANNRLLMANWGTNSAIKAVSLTDYAVSTLHGTGLANVDGIALDNLGRIYISSWQPQRVTRYSENFTVTENIITTGLGNPADICYALAVDTLAVPNSSTSTVLFVGFGTSGMGETDEDDAVGLAVFPNPATDHARVSLFLKEAARLRLELVDAMGRTVKVPVNEAVPAGRTLVPFVLNDVANGAYTVRIWADERVMGAVPLVVK